MHLILTWDVSNKHGMKWGFKTQRGFKKRKQGHARCNGPAVFGCFARRPKSRFEDPYSTLCFSLCAHVPFHM